MPLCVRRRSGMGWRGSWMNQGGRNDITDYSYRGLFSLLSGSLIKLTSLYKQQMTKTLNWYSINKPQSTYSICFGIFILNLFVKTRRTKVAKTAVGAAIYFCLAVVCLWCHAESRHVEWHKCLSTASSASLFLLFVGEEWTNIAGPRGAQTGDRNVLLLHECW